MAEQTTGDLLTAWRRTTFPQHKKLEADLDLLRPAPTRDDYLRLLMGSFAFYEPYEYLLRNRADSIPAAKFYLPERAKLPHLLRDLRDLGQSESQIAGIPRAALPSEWAHSEAAHWGCLYVIEGSMFGGQVIANHFKQKLGLDSGLRFYEGYSGETAQKWREFIACIQHLELSTSDFEVAVRAAGQAFSVLGEQLLKGRSVN